MQHAGYIIQSEKGAQGARNSHDRGGVIEVGLGQTTRAVVFEGKSIEVIALTGVRLAGQGFEKAA